MSPETIRRAAALMRERAEVGRLDGYPSPWSTSLDDHLHNTYEVLCHEDGSGLVTEDLDRDVAEYIASWHPAVALAVADWLDTAGADLWAHGPLCECGSGCHACDDSLWQPHARRALAVARAYLGESS